MLFGNWGFYPIALKRIFGEILSVKNWNAEKSRKSNITANMIWGSAKRRLHQRNVQQMEPGAIFFPVSCPRYGTAYNAKTTCHKNVTVAVRPETKYRK